MLNTNRQWRNFKLPRASEPQEAYEEAFAKLNARHTVAVLGKIFGGGAGPSSFGRQPRLSEITIEPISGVLLKS